MLSDIEIAQNVKMEKIMNIAKSLGLSEDEVILYGDYKAKIKDSAFARLDSKKNGKLILVTAINPTPAGEGKTTTSVGLAMAINKIGKKAICALREPSLGPVFGIKGGAAGGGYSQVLPMEDINLHFTGDIHAVTAANNLICAMIDNHLQQGNALNIDPRRIVFGRVLDLNDRSLRKVVIGMGGKANGIVREDSFAITASSEVMAILCLSKNMSDLKLRIGGIIIGYTFDNRPVFCSDLKCEGAVAVLLRDAILPNLVQTTENTPCFIHGGPFANIAHGCNSVKATKLSLKLADYCITEAGFGSDLGAEKFFDIKCRAAGLSPDACVIVATVRALKYNGGIKKEDLKLPNVNAVKLGGENLKAHIANIKNFNVPAVVAINKFETDTDEELNAIKEICLNEGAAFAVSEVFTKGGEGGIELANEVCRIAENKNEFKYVYPLKASIEEKIEAVVKKVYGGSSVGYDLEAQKSINHIKEMGYGNLPVCIAKTQYSLSDNQFALGRPSGFKINVRSVKLSAGAGFIVVITGDIMTMPGLPKIPAAQNIDIDEDGSINGLF